MLLQVREARGARFPRYIRRLSSAPPLPALSLSPSRSGVVHDIESTMCLRHKHTITGGGGGDGRADGGGRQRQSLGQLVVWLAHLFSLEASP